MHVCKFSLSFVFKGLFFLSYSVSAIVSESKTSVVSLSAICSELRESCIMFFWGGGVCLCFQHCQKSGIVRVSGADMKPVFRVQRHFACVWLLTRPWRVTAKGNV